MKRKLFTRSTIIESFSLKRLLIICSLLIFSIFLFNICYSAFNKDISLTNTYAYVRKNNTIRITGASFVSSSGGSSLTTSMNEYSVNTINFSVNFPSYIFGNNVVYSIEIKNFDTKDYVLSSIDGVPSGLSYSFVDYTLGNVLTSSDSCSNASNCSGNIPVFNIQLKFSNSIFTSFNQSFTLTFNFKEVHNVTYENFSSVSGYPTTVADGETLSITFASGVNYLSVTEGGAVLSSGDYTFSNRKFTLTNVTGNVHIKQVIPDFATDSWSTILANVEKDPSIYAVGSTREISLTGFTNGESGSNGKYTIRVANNTTPSACSNSGFSQTACGFVIEFVDIITNYYVNPTGTYNGTYYGNGSNYGGWPESSIRNYLNTTIYDALPADLQSVILSTYTVSGHGNISGDTNNYTNRDLLYLLTGVEVKNDTGYDSATSLTRQLDYYAANSSSAAIKNYNGTANWWWLRSANNETSECFLMIYSDTSLYGHYVNDPGGVAPAFKIGTRSSLSHSISYSGFDSGSYTSSVTDGGTLVVNLGSSTSDVIVKMGGRTLTSGYTFSNHILTLPKVIDDVTVIANNTRLVTIDGAADDSITVYQSDGSTVVYSNLTADSSGKICNVSLNPGTYVLSSSISEYSRSVTVDSSTTMIKAYPDGTIYWFGNGDASGETLYAMTGGFTLSGSGTLAQETYDIGFYFSAQSDSGYSSTIAINNSISMAGYTTLNYLVRYTPTCSSGSPVNSYSTTYFGSLNNSNESGYNSSSFSVSSGSYNFSVYNKGCYCWSTKSSALTTRAYVYAVWRS